MIMMLASLVLPFLFALAAYGPSLVMFLLYLSVRHHPTAPVSLFGFVTLQSVYLPWAFLVLGFAGLGGDPRGVGLGILAGHVVWFLTDVFPRGGGRALLAPPAWLVRACLARGIGAIPTPAAVAATVNPADPGFRAFVGRGQRLGQRTG
jgi:Derlin-2/3